MHKILGQAIPNIEKKAYANLKGRLQKSLLFHWWNWNNIYMYLFMQSVYIFALAKHEDSVFESW